MCALLASAEKIVRIVNRGQVYELVYTMENTPRIALENLQFALVELYSASLALLANSGKLFSKNAATRTVSAIFHPGETAGLFSELTDLDTKLRSEVQACEIARKAAVDARLMDLLHGLEAPLTRIDETVCTLLERVNSKEQLEILEWISAIPYGKHHNTVREARTSDTCQWLLQHERFREWQDTSSSVILWLRGSRKLSVADSCRARRFIQLEKPT
jgi:ankyrin repeat domain-containing protein 50